MKIKSIKSFDPKNPTVMVIRWEDGKTSTFDLADLTPEIVAHCAWHGLNQRTMDAHAGVYKETGSIAKCREVSEDVYATLLRGMWSEGRGSTPWIIEAIAEVMGMEHDEAAQLWDGLDEKGQKEVRNHPDVKRWKAQRDLDRLGDAPAADLKDLLK